MIVKNGRVPNKLNDLVIFRKLRFFCDDLPMKRCFKIWSEFCRRKKDLIRQVEFMQKSSDKNILLKKVFKSWGLATRKFQSADFSIGNLLQLSLKRNFMRKWRHFAQLSRCCQEFQQRFSKSKLEKFFKSWRETARRASHAREVLRIFFKILVIWANFVRFWILDEFGKFWSISTWNFGKNLVTLVTSYWYQF